MPIAAVRSRTIVVGFPDESKQKPTQSGVEPPTEVIANTLTVTINLAEPSEDGQWPMDMSALGVQGPILIDDLDSGLAELMVKVRSLAVRWRDKLRRDRDE